MTFQTCITLKVLLQKQRAFPNFNWKTKSKLQEHTSILLFNAWEDTHRIDRQPCVLLSIGFLLLLICCNIFQLLPRTPKKAVCILGCCAIVKQMNHGLAVVVPLHHYPPILHHHCLRCHCLLSSSHKTGRWKPKPCLVVNLAPGKDICRQYFSVNARFIMALWMETRLKICPRTDGRTDHSHRV